MERSIRIAKVEAFVLRSPLATPVVTSFGTMRDRPALLVRIRDEDGATGWGEAWCNFPAPAAEHRARLVEQVLAPLVEGTTLDDTAAVGTVLAQRTRILAIQCAEPGPFAQAIAAIEMAAWDLTARRAGVPLWKLLGGRGHVPVYASGIHPKQAAQLVEAAKAGGHTRFKIKVGFDLAADVACVEAMAREHAADAWMIDANQGWESSNEGEGAACALQAFAHLPLAWVEEPVAADSDAATWRRLAQLGLPLAAGENLRGMPAFEEAGEWLNVLQPDPGKWGGVSGCLQVAAHARARSRWFCPHWLGGGVGLAFSVALLDAHLAAGADSRGWAEVDVNPNPLRDGLIAWCDGIERGQARLGTAPGIGPEPEPSKF
jgi:D-galactarolactone cycloisomerase